MRFRALCFAIPDVPTLRAGRPEAAVIDWKLEDQVFKHLMPEEYRAMSRLVNRKRAERDAYTRNCIRLLTEALEGAGVNAVVYGRTKHLYSIYQKLRRYHASGRSFRDMHDLTALRVIVNSVTDCYYALGVVHQTWRPVADRFDDYIASPKQNRYQSLHTSVFGEQGRRLEVQIRTKKMHRIAEEGLAAHLSYKQREPGWQRPRVRGEPPRSEPLFERRPEVSQNCGCLEA